MQLTPFIAKDSLRLIKVCVCVEGMGDLSFTGDSEQCGDFYNLQALSCSVSVSKGTALNIVGQHDQRTLLTAVEVVEE